MEPDRETLPAPVLVVGAPRSGTTWIGQVLSHTDGLCFVHEPDNETQRPFAARAKRTLGRWPVLDAGDRVPDGYHRLWERAFAGRIDRTSPRFAAAKLLLRGADKVEMRAAFCSPDAPTVSRRLRAVGALAPPPARRQRGSVTLVKSVHAPLAVEWIAARWQPRFLIVMRHPFEVVASWLELGWGGARLDRHPLVRERYVEALGVRPLHEGCSHVGIVAWQVALFTLALERAAVAHPDWHVASHERLCRDPEGEFALLCGQLGLAWTEAARGFVASSNRPGTRAQTFRVTKELPDRWRHRLDDDQVREVRWVLDGFPLRAFGDGESPGRAV